MAITLHRGSDFMGERYKYDFRVLTYAKGWAQVDTRQDASYYGNWTNPDLRELFSYCEGDTCLTKCDTDDDYRQAVTEMVEWHSERDYWLGIDAGLGSDMRSKFVVLGLEKYLH